MMRMEEEKVEIQQQWEFLATRVDDCRVESPLAWRQNDLRGWR